MCFFLSLLIDLSSRLQTFIVSIYTSLTIFPTIPHVLFEALPAVVATLVVQVVPVLNVAAAAFDQVRLATQNQKKTNNHEQKCITTTIPLPPISLAYSVAISKNKWKNSF